MSYIKPDDWTPSPGIKLEGTALEIVRSNSSMSVLAGPGAGKTELLAQRAAYLLETGLCPPPLRILAIAFKVDAAQNLKDRVSGRCNPSQLKRFESFTLHAFAKKIVDQFIESLPFQLRPSANFKILFTNRNAWRDFKDQFAADYPFIRGFNDTQLEKIVYESVPTYELEAATTQEQQIRLLWWRYQLDTKPSFLTFDMIMLLATYILQTQKNILNALQQTYSHVFLDEFQDVTNSQYNLIKAAFSSSSAVLTAVGDSNQAIMRWAGARADIFDLFETDFHASDKRLQFNYRSNSRIVGLINDLAATFDDDYIVTECARHEAPVPANAVQGWVFETRQSEGEYLASFIAEELRNDANLIPGDFVILARLRVDEVENRLEGDFQGAGLKIRNEARAVGGIAIQDLVKEKAYSFLLAALKLAVNVREGQPFQDCRNTIADVRGSDLNSDKGHSVSLSAVKSLVEALKDMINGRPPTDISGQEVTNIILSHVERAELQRTYKEYSGGNRLGTIISGFEVFFDECRNDAASWSESIANMEGVGSVRLMTIHKSKGLEYHSVMFVEFNDDAFWGNEDDVNVFFVALSRARERVYFSFTKDSRGASNIKGFVEKLQAANVNFMNK